MNIGCDDTEKIVAFIKSISNSISVNDIEEIVLNNPKVEKEEKQEFNPESKRITINSNFLLEGKQKSEYKKYCDMFNQFITGPAVEGREITELTEKYQKFYDVIRSTPLKTQESNKLEDALFGVAIEAEMQGFIYGFKLFDAFLNKQLAVVI